MLLNETISRWHVSDADFITTKDIRKDCEDIFVMMRKEADIIKESIREDEEYFGESYFNKQDLQKNREDNLFRRTMRQQSDMCLTNYFEQERLEDISRKYFCENPPDLTSILKSDVPQINTTNNKPETENTLVIPKDQFQMLVDEILQQMDLNLDVQDTAYTLLQEAVETYLNQLMSEVDMVAMHSKRLSIEPKDIALVQKMKNEKCRHK